MPATYAANKAAIWQLTPPPPPPPPKQTNIKRQMKCASDSAPWRPLGDQTPNMLGGVYLQKYSERSKYKTLDRLPSSSSPFSLSFVYVVCVRLSIKTFGISISILDARQRLRSGPGHLLDVVLKGAALFSAAALLIYSANRSVFKVNTFTVAWLSVLSSLKRPPSTFLWPD